MQGRDSTDRFIIDKKERKTLIFRSSREQGQEVRGLAVLSTPAWIRLLGCYGWSPQEQNYQKAYLKI